MRSGATSFLLMLLLSASACGQGDDPVASSGPDASAAQTILTASQRLQATIEWPAGAPAKGSNTVEITFRTLDGAPVTGLSVAVVPWMPAHAHGTSVKPATTETSPGVFVAAPIYFYMAGQWQLRISTGGAVDDSAIATYDVR